MNTVISKGLRAAYRTIRSEKSIPVDISGQEASNEIAKKIISGEPCLVARIGATEFGCLTGFMQSKAPKGRYLNYITGRLDSLGLDEKMIAQAYQWSGIFPAEKEIVEKFSLLTLEDLKEVDILGVWLKEHNLLAKELTGKLKIPLRDIEPYYHKTPWSKALAGKRVLVIHPFARSVESQYLKFENLFENKEVLPKFELKVLQSVQSIAGQPTEFSNWFEALDFMKKQIDEIEFDIAIIGCGAYGLSLGAHIKRIGKQAVHMGGATQILFGIKGKRWDNHPKISQLYNEYWSRPLEEETPKNKNKVEDGCYW